MVLCGVLPARTGGNGSREWAGPRAGVARWCLAEDGRGVPLDPAVGAPWRLVAASAGRPVTVAGEWTATGLRPLSVWADDRLVRL